MGSSKLKESEHWHNAQVADIDHKACGAPVYKKALQLFEEAHRPEGLRN